MLSIEKNFCTVIFTLKFFKLETNVRQKNAIYNKIQKVLVQNVVTTIEFKVNHL